MMEAEKKKACAMMEAEKKKACAMISQVQVAKSDQQEDRSQTMVNDNQAKKEALEYFRQRCQQHSLKRMEKQAIISRCWRKFVSSRRTTLHLVKDYDSLKINENSMKTMPFKELCSVIELPATLQTVEALLDRLESRYKACSYASTLDNNDHLLKIVLRPMRRPTPRSTVRSRDAKNASSRREATMIQAKSSRYPVRVVLCAYVILGHPDAVFSGQGQREAALAKSAKEFIHEFEVLVRIILEGRVQSSDDESESMRCTFRRQLAVFDKAWCTYLSCFVAWKVKEADLVRDQMSGSAKLLISEKVILNELLHDQMSGLIDRFDAGKKDEENLKAKIRETMEKAFWENNILNSEEGPDYDRLVNLAREVRDGISEMAPDKLALSLLEKAISKLMGQLKESEYAQLWEFLISEMSASMDSRRRKKIISCCYLIASHISSDLIVQTMKDIKTLTKISYFCDVKDFIKSLDTLLSIRAPTNKQKQ